MAKIFSTNPRSRKLIGLVQSIWVYQSNQPFAYEHVLPSTTSQLLINLHEEELRHWDLPGEKLHSVGSIGAQGVLTAPVLIDTEQKRDVCGVAFTDYGLSAFCTIAASCFTDSIIDGASIWGQSTILLRSALLAEPNAENQCQIIEAFLLKHLVNNSDETELIEAIVASMLAGTSITNIRKQAELSQRGLHALFDRRIGVKPKMFARISRFKNSLDSMAKTHTLADLASVNRYADQAHFTREFRSFTGMAPTHYQPIPNEKRHVACKMNKIFKTSSND